MSVALRQVRAALEYKSPVLVSSGDPLFYGVARYLCDRLGKNLFEVVPHVSSMQLAFARIKESWEDAYLTSLTGRPIEAVIDRIRTAEKIGLFSSDEYTPARLAVQLLERGIDYFRAYVCENLGSPDERVTQAVLADLVAMEFNPLNVMILIREPNRPDLASRASRHRLFGNPDDAFAQSLPKRGLITHAEVRAIALAQLDIRSTSIVWDIGAGSGSVAIEAAQLASQGMVYAIEPEPSDVALIQANAELFGVPNVRAILGRRPRSWRVCPSPRPSSWAGQAGKSTRSRARRSQGCVRGEAWPLTWRRLRGWPPPITRSRRSPARFACGTCPSHAASNKWIGYGSSQSLRHSCWQSPNETNRVISLCLPGIPPTRKLPIESLPMSGSLHSQNREVEFLWRRRRSRSST